MSAIAPQFFPLMSDSPPAPRRHRPARPIRVPENQLAAYIAAGQPILGIVRFGEGLPPVELPAGLPLVTLPMNQLGAESVAEVWVSDRPVSWSSADDTRFGSDGEVLFAALNLADDASATPELAAYRAYRVIMGTVADRGYPHLLRMWNYFPDINRDVIGLERYRRFCLGRYQAFEERGLSFDGDLPAATAIGIAGAGSWIYVLASRRPGVQIENPRQVSAYRYPPQYGPRSPSFSRASLATFGTEQQLYISGTASIVGHESVHIGDPLAQLSETLANIQAILDQPGPQRHPSLSQLGAESELKVYLRHADDFNRIAERLRNRLGRRCGVLYLQGDICRADLLLEIEAVIGLSP